MSEPETHLAVSSGADRPEVRRALRKWLLKREVPELVAVDVVMVADEALAQADGPVSITAATFDTEIVLTVHGHGEIDPSRLTRAAEHIEADKTTITARFPLPRVHESGPIRIPRRSARP